MDESRNEASQPLLSNLMRAASTSASLAAQSTSSSSPRPQSPSRRAAAFRQPPSPNSAARKATLMRMRTRRLSMLLEASSSKSLVTLDQNQEFEVNPDSEPVAITRTMMNSPKLLSRGPQANVKITIPSDFQEYVPINTVAGHSSDYMSTTSSAPEPSSPTADEIQESEQVMAGISGGKSALLASTNAFSATPASSSSPIGSEGSTFPEIYEVPNSSHTFSSADHHPSISFASSSGSYLGALWDACLSCYHSLPSSTRIPYYVPIAKWLPNYSRNQLFGDMSAGFTVGIMLVAQGIAYAPLARRPTRNGLFCAFFPLLVYVLLGTSSSLSLGPEIITSTLIGQTLDALTSADATLDPDAVARTLSFVVGFIVLVMGILRLGYLESVLAHTVVSGLINAICVNVIITQAPLMFGFKVDPESSESSYEAISYFFDNVTDLTNKYTLLVATLTMAFLVICLALRKRWPHNKWISKFPAILFAVVGGTLISYCVDLQSFGVQILGHVDDGFEKPSDHWPSLSQSDIMLVLSKASVLSLLNFIETFVVAKHYAQQAGEVISPNRELVALGLSNVFGSLFGAYPASGSLSRSKVNHDAGAATPAAGFFASLVVLFAVLFMLPLLHTLPQPVIASIIVVVTAGIIDIQELLLCFRLRLWQDVILWIVIFVSVFFFGIDRSIFLALAMCFMWLVKGIAIIQPRIIILGQLQVSKMRAKAMLFLTQARLVEEMANLELERRGIKVANENNNDGSSSGSENESDRGVENDEEEDTFTTSTSMEQGYNNEGDISMQLSVDSSNDDSVITMSESESVSTSTSHPISNSHSPTTSSTIIPPEAGSSIGEPCPSFPAHQLESSSSLSNYSADVSVAILSDDLPLSSTNEPHTSQPSSIMSPMSSSTSFSRETPASAKTPALQTPTTTSNQTSSSSTTKPTPTRQRSRSMQASSTSNSVITPKASFRLTFGNGGVLQATPSPIGKDAASKLGGLAASSSKSPAFFPATISEDIESSSSVTFGNSSSSITSVPPLSVSSSAEPLFSSVAAATSILNKSLLQTRSPLTASSSSSSKTTTTSSSVPNFHPVHPAVSTVGLSGTTTSTYQGIVAPEDEFEYVDISEFPEAEPVPGMIILKLTGAINFATIGRIQVLLRRLLQFGSISHQPGEVGGHQFEDDVILDMHDIPSLDGSAVSTFVDSLTDFTRHGRQVLLVGVRDNILKLLIRIRRFRRLSDGAMFSTVHDAVQALQSKQRYLSSLGTSGMPRLNSLGGHAPNQQHPILNHGISQGRRRISSQPQHYHPNNQFHNSSGLGNHSNNPSGQNSPRI